MNEGNAQIAILTRLLDHRTDRRFQKVPEGSRRFQRAKVAFGTHR
jgi:hypothetical protein